MLDNAIAVVTGGTKGIGRAIVGKLAESGALVIFTGRDEAAAEETIAHAGAAPERVLFKKVDMADTEQVRAFFDSVIKEHGRIDVLVNNAGVTKDTLVMRMREEDWDAVINLNLKSTFICCQAVTRQMMKQRSGSIINISSVIGLGGNAGQANYAASKAGIIGLTKSLAKELGPRGVRANAVAPGFIETEMTAVLSEELRDKVLQGIPLGRLGKPDEIADVVRFLASDDSRYMTGQVMVVDGGLVM